MYTNAQSLVGKVNELSCAVADLNPDIILVTETWCSKDITDAYLSIPGYELRTELRQDREGTRGGGLVTYAKHGIPVLKIDKTAEHFQLCSFLVFDITISLLYRPPSAPADSITELCELVMAAGKNSILIGDFNLPGVDWQGRTVRGRAEGLLEAVGDAMMEQLVDFPTQVKGNTLDLIITNIPERVEEVSECGRLGKSDHVVIAAKVRTGGVEDEHAQQPDWRRADWDAMRAELKTGDWRSKIRWSRAAEAWEILRRKVTELAEKYVPNRRKRNNNRPAWLTQDILREIRRKKRLWKAVKSGQPCGEYKAAEKKVSNLIRNAKRRFEKKLAASNGGQKRQFFAYIKQKTQSRPTVGPLKNVSGEVVTDSEGMANVLNMAFKEVFTREDTNNIPDPEQLQTNTYLSEVRFSARVVKKKIRELRTEAAAGPDGIGPRILQELQEDLAPALSDIFTKSMDEGVVPQDWKEANVTPIFNPRACQETTDRFHSPQLAVN